jgi:NADPH:quinone reductase-like Zn-dependent oxidoreductase
MEAGTCTIIGSVKSASGATMDDSSREATAWPARPSRVVIFGATGVVGRRLVPLLLEGGSHVTAVLRDRRRAGVLPASPRLRIVTG